MFTPGKISGDRTNGHGRTRTTDTGIFNAVLYQLSYVPGDPAQGRSRSQEYAPDRGGQLARRREDAATPALGGTIGTIRP